MNFYHQIYHIHILSCDCISTINHLPPKIKWLNEHLHRNPIRFSEIWSSIQQRRWIDTTIFKHFLAAFYFYFGNTTICCAKWSTSLVFYVSIIGNRLYERLVFLYKTKPNQTVPFSFVYTYSLHTIKTLDSFIFCLCN